jgi:hypothetical protein
MTVTTGGGVSYASGQDFYDKILTDHYRNVVADTRNNATPLTAQIPDNSEYVGGRFITFPARTRRNIGVNAVRYTSGYKMPDPGSQGASQYSFAPRHIFARVKVDGLTWAAAQKDVDRYIDLIDWEIGGISDDIAVEEERMLNNDGSGRLAEVVSIGGGGNTVITLRINQGIEGPVTCTTPPTLFVHVGDRLGFCASDGTSMTVLFVVTVPSSSTITCALTSGGAATDATAAGVLADDWVVRISSSDVGTDAVSSGFRSEPMGIGGMFSDANCKDGTGLLSAGTAGVAGSMYYGNTAASLTFQGQDCTVAGNEFNQAVVLDNAGVPRPLTEALMQYGFSEAEERNNATIDMLHSGFAMRDTYIDLLLPQKRFNNTLELKGGFKALDFNGVPWTVGRFCYRNRIFGFALQGAGFTRYIVEPMGFVDMGGGARWGKTSFDDEGMQAALVERHNYGLDVRQRAGFLITDVSEIR